MKTRLTVLQEDLRYYEDFIFELSKYNRQFAADLNEGLANNDPLAIEIMEMAIEQVINEGIGTAMDRGAQLADTHVNQNIGLSGRVSKFLLLDKPAKVAGAAIGAAAHLMGKDVGGSRSGKKEKKDPNVPTTGDSTAGGAGSGSGAPNVTYNISGPMASSSTGPVSVRGGDVSQGGASIGDITNTSKSAGNTIRQKFQRSSNTITSSYDMTLGGERVDLAEQITLMGENVTQGGASIGNITNTSSSKGNVINVSGSKRKKKEEPAPEKETPAEEQPKSGMSFNIGNIKAPDNAGDYSMGTGMWSNTVNRIKERKAKETPVKPETETPSRDSGLSTGPAMDRLTDTIRKLDTVGATSKSTPERTASNIDAAVASGGGEHMAAATTNSFGTRVMNMASKLKSGIGSRLGAVKDIMTQDTGLRGFGEMEKIHRETNKLDPNRPMTPEDEARVRGASVGREGTLKAIAANDKKIAKSLAGRSAEKISAETGKETSPETVGGAASVVGSLRGAFDNIQGGIQSKVNRQQRVRDYADKSGSQSETDTFTRFSPKRGLRGRMGGSPSMMTPTGRFAKAAGDIEVGFPEKDIRTSARKKKMGQQKMEANPPALQTPKKSQAKRGYQPPSFNIGDLNF